MSPAATDHGTAEPATSEVLVHRAWLDVGPALLARLHALLDGTERRRAAAIRPAACRRRFIAAHGFLRQVLGRRTGMAPAEVRFTRGAWGKPRLATPEASGDVCFSMSRAGPLALFAIAQGREVGIDVERIRPVPALGIARRFLTAEEADSLAVLNEEQRAEAFLRIWTRREALGKARGHGLLAERATTADGSWEISDLDPGPGYVAALAVEASRATLPLAT